MNQYEKYFDEVQFEVTRLEESWYQWPQELTVPAGYWYRESIGGVKLAEEDVSIQLCCAGDWLELVKSGDKIGVRYEIF